MIARDFDGQRYVLYGFRSGNSVCLKLQAVTLRSALPPACAPVSVVEHLSAPVVPVAGDRSVIAFPQRRSAKVSFGIAADQVRRVVVKTTNGNHTAVLSGNACLWVDPTPATFDAVELLQVTTTDGRKLSQPVPPTSFLAVPLTPVTLRGPRRVEAKIPNPHIGWLQRGEKRGLSPAQAHIGASRLPGLSTAKSLRLFKPDPTSNIVVGLNGGCIYLDGAYGCSPLDQFFSRGPINFMLSGGSAANSSDQFLELGGTAADGVTGVRAFLPDGSSLNLSLKDNMFTGIVPNQSPVRVVAYRSDGKIVGIETLGNPRAVPPSARRVLPVIRVTGAHGTAATLLLGSQVSGVRCWQIRTTVDRNRGQCESIPITGPWVGIEGVQNAGRSIFVFGYLRSPVTKISLGFDDGSSVDARTGAGWFLAAIPASRIGSSRRHARVVGRDASGRVVQQPAFFYKLER